MNAIPADVATFLEDRFATIRDLCFYRDNYRNDYWRDATIMGKKMGSLLLSNPHLTDETILQILGVLSFGESRGLRLSLMDSNNGSDIFEHILQIHTKGRNIIFYSYLSYFEGRSYMGSILEDQHIYLWEDQALKFFRLLVDLDYDNEMEEQAVMRCVWNMSQRLHLIPGAESYDAMREHILPFAFRFYRGHFTGDSVARFWALYLCTHPQLVTEDMLRFISQNFITYQLSYFYTTIRNIHPDLLDVPLVAEYYEQWETVWDEETRRIDEEELISDSE